jgi:parvulin-like peptidyl-prolyl isomerase
MKKQIKLILPAAFATALLALPSVQAASTNAAANAAAANAPASTVTNTKSTNATNAITALFGDPAIARGKGFEIKRSELDDVMAGFKSAAAEQGQVVPQARLVQFEGQMLNRLIQIQLLLQKATAADKADGDKKAGLQISNLVARVGSPETLDRQLKASGMTVAELRSKTIQRLTAEAVLTRELNATVTDAEAKQFYDDTNNLRDFEQPEMVSVRHILLLTVDPVTQAPLTMEQQQNKHKQAEAVLKRARTGEDFMALVKQYSEDPMSKNGTNEITLARGNPSTPPEIEAAAFSLTNNQISDVITTTVGYDIIKLLSKTPAKKLVLTEKWPMSDMTVTDRIKEGLKQQKIEKQAPAYLDKLQKDADVQILDADLKAAAAAAAAAANAPAGTPEK